MTTPNTTTRTAGICVLAAAVVLGLSGCNGGGAGATTNTPTTTTVTSPTSSSTAPSSTAPSSTAPSTTTSPTPSSTHDQALIDEAKKVLDSQFKMEELYFKQGGWPRGLKVPPELTDLMMEEGLDSTLEGIHQVWEKQIVYKSGASVISDVHVADVDPYQGSIIALQSCQDGRAVRTVVGEGQTPSHGRMVRHTSYFKRDSDGKLKMSNWTGKTVESCGS